MSSFQFVVAHAHIIRGIDFQALFWFLWIW